MRPHPLSSAAGSAVCAGLRGDPVRGFSQRLPGTGNAVTRLGCRGPPRRASDTRSASPFSRETETVPEEGSFCATSAPSLSRLGRRQGDVGDTRPLGPSSSSRGRDASEGHEAPGLAPLAGRWRRGRPAANPRLPAARSRRRRGRGEAGARRRRRSGYREGPADHPGPGLGVQTRGPQVQ